MCRAGLTHRIENTETGIDCFIAAGHRDDVMLAQNLHGVAHSLRDVGERDAIEPEVRRIRPAQVVGRELAHTGLLAGSTQTFRPVPKTHAVDKYPTLVDLLLLEPLTQNCDEPQGMGTTRVEFIDLGSSYSLSWSIAQRTDGSTLASSTRSEPQPLVGRKRSRTSSATTSLGRSPDQPEIAHMTAYFLECESRL